MKDCFAFNGGGCGFLKVAKCSKRCNFYKTHQQLRIERQKAYNRLMDLGRLDLFERYDIPKE